MSGYTLAKEDLQNAAERLVAKLQKDSWGGVVEAEGLPLKIDVVALEEILKSANEHAFKLLEIATGVAYMRRHDDVTGEDAKTAIEVYRQGVDQVLKSPPEEW